MRVVLKIFLNISNPIFRLRSFFVAFFFSEFRHSAGGVFSRAGYNEDVESVGVECN